MIQLTICTGLHELRASLIQLTICTGLHELRASFHYLHAIFIISFPAKTLVHWCWLSDFSISSSLLTSLSSSSTLHEKKRKKREIIVDGLLNLRRYTTWNTKGLQVPCEVSSPLASLPVLSFVYLLVCFCFFFTNSSAWVLWRQTRVNNVENYVHIKSKKYIIGGPPIIKVHAQKDL